MAREKKQPEGEGAEAAPEKKGKKKKVLIIFVVLLLAVGGVGFKMYKAKHAGLALPKPGNVVPLDSVTLNLADGHFLKLGLALQYVEGKPAASKDAAAATPESEGAHALDLAIGLFSNQTMSKLMTPAGRDQAKAALKTQVEKAYDGDVMDVYFTEFVMQ